MRVDYLFDVTSFMCILLRHSY